VCSCFDWYSGDDCSIFAYDILGPELTAYAAIFDIVFFLISVHALLGLLHNLRMQKQGQPWWNMANLTLFLAFLGLSLRIVDLSVEYSQLTSQNIVTLTTSSLWNAGTILWLLAYAFVVLAWIDMKQMNKKDMNFLHTGLRRCVMILAGCMAVILLVTMVLRGYESTKVVSIYLNNATLALYMLIMSILLFVFGFRVWRVAKKTLKEFATKGRSLDLLKRITERLLQGNAVMDTMIATNLIWLIVDPDRANPYIQAAFDALLSLQEAIAISFLLAAVHPASLVGLRVYMLQLLRGKTQEESTRADSHSSPSMERVPSEKSEKSESEKKSTDETSTSDEPKPEETKKSQSA